jgi:hypothetical protein
MLRLSRRGAAPPRSHTPGPLSVLHWKLSRRRELRSQKFVMLLGKRLSGMLVILYNSYLFVLQQPSLWFGVTYDLFVWILMLNLNINE